MKNNDNCPKFLAVEPDRIPVRTELTVLPADPDRPIIGYTIYETLGISAFNSRGGMSAITMGRGCTRGETVFRLPPL